MNINKQNSRKKYSAEFKAKVALSAVRGENTIAELCKVYNLHQGVIKKWKGHLIKNISIVFDSKSSNKQTPEHEISNLHAKIGELLIECLTSRRISSRRQSFLPLFGIKKVLCFHD